MARDPALDVARAAYPELAEAALVDRRMALKLMAASAALAAASGCTGPGERRTLAAGGSRATVPTTLEQNGLGFGVTVETVDGHPVKIEGHPEHPASLGRSNVFAQAALLTHYDPERLRRPVLDGREAGWDAVQRLLAGLRGDEGAGLHILIEPAASPTLEQMVGEAQAALPRAHFYGHRALPLALTPQPDFGADVIVSLGCDFLGPGPAQVANAAAWIAARRRARATGRTSRLVVIESVPSLTGARADLRIAASPSEMTALAAALAERSLDRLPPALGASLANAGRVELVAGQEAPAAVRAALRTSGDGDPAPVLEGAALRPLPMLAGALAAGNVRTLLILGGNPLYDAPPDLRIAERLRRAGTSLYLGSEANETAVACRHRLPSKSALGRWGDLRAFDGTVSLVRPVVREAGLTAIELLAALAGRAPDGEALVRATHGLDSAELDALSGGILIPGAAPAPAAAAPPVPAPTPPAAPGTVALVLRPSTNLWDGSLSGNAWAQELPDPITGLAWGNAATLAPEDAEAWGIADGELIELAAGSASVTVPAKRLAGQARGTVGLALGYGRLTGLGADVGVNGFALAGNGLVRDGVRLRRAGGTARLIYPNEPFRTGENDPVRWVAPGEAIAAAEDTPGFATPRPQAAKQWGMAIDLDACIGCNACTIACQAENNIPVVGPEEVAMGRVMHWIRVDRHESGDGGSPASAHQPVPCMHCETAPCEPVCPVEATTHSSEGLNQMTYQRCIGTRSCSNNCPYKVRRFNWFDYAADAPMPERGQNPRVHVRERGVMEKCTYCVQRIEAVRTGDAEGPPVTACQQACPTRAIVFGDISDPESAVAEARRSPRNYALLDGLNLQPRTTYLARVKAGD
ncbi:4Fe-4S dicluster domain-containing protein [Sphingosinithalassobacter sp. CS137]|uniref:4Fe-4S dicluster domain-containing protein n=1 Tax=Sphingosinithalassobacter sp. CS137 TaxID=2762748 RepID=UPI00165EAD35|nr:4Fe-4S dicluster domain-containing protein [Sphingosinithalassobacter sp. CS137]